MSLLPTSMSKVWKMLFFLECVATCRFIGFVLVISAIKTNPNLSGQRTQVKRERPMGVQPWLYAVRKETFLSQVTSGPSCLEESRLFFQVLIWILRQLVTLRLNGKFQSDRKPWHLNINASCLYVQNTSKNSVGFWLSWLGLGLFSEPWLEARALAHSEYVLSLSCSPSPSKAYHENTPLGKPAGGCQADSGGRWFYCCQRWLLHALLPTEVVSHFFQHPPWPSV